MLMHLQGPEGTSQLILQEIPRLPSVEGPLVPHCLHAFGAIPLPPLLTSAQSMRRAIKDDSRGRVATQKKHRPPVE